MNIPEPHRAAIERLAALSDSEAASLRQALATLSPTLKPQEIAERARASVDLSGISEIVSALMGMNSARFNSETSVEEFVGSVANVVFRRPDRIKGIDRKVFEERLASFLTVESLALAAKAFDVQHEYQKLFASARILTDLRPVFDQDGTELIASVVVHNLKLTYFEAGEYKHIFIALDKSDVVALRKVLDRAELKNASIEKNAEKLGVPNLET